MDIKSRLSEFLSRHPSIPASAFVHPDATVVGAVELGPESSVWPQAVLRGDINQIVVGRGTNIQDGTVVHLADEYGVTIGDYTTIGHLAIVHACTVGHRVLVGMHSTILDGAVIGNECIIGAGSLVTGKTEIAEGSLVYGSPARVVRPLTAEERSSLKGWALKYLDVAKAHRAQLNLKHF